MGTETANSDNRKSNSQELRQIKAELATGSENEIEDAPKEGMHRSTEETMTNDKLKKLQEVFAEADEDGGGGLGMEEFRHAMRQSLGMNISDDDLDQIFMKVDTNCDGTVDWDEYLTYMLLECREKDNMNIKAKQPFPKPLRDCKPSGHRDSVVRILFMPQNFSTSQEGDLSRGCYISVSRDGIVCFWTLTLKLGAVHKIESAPPGTKDIWITDACYIPSANFIGFSTTARDIVLYEVANNGFRFNKLSRINGLDTCASKLYYYDAGIKQSSILLFGDCRGGVGVIRFYMQPQHTILNVKGKKKDSEYLSLAFAKILKGDMDGMEGNFMHRVHEEEVRQIMYCPPLSCFLSCSAGTDTALFLGDLNRRFHKAYFNVRKGINCFDYSYKLNVIVTGGYDTIVRVWNPYVQTRPSIHLQGHQSPVLHVVINSPREQIISMSESNEIRIHDMNTQVCLQTIYKKQMVGMGKRPALSVFLNHTKQDFILATKILGILEHKSIDYNIPYIQTQGTPIIMALYNPLFKQVVSVGDNSMITVWSIMTGEKVIQFSANKTKDIGNTDENVGAYSEVITMTFDPSMRRLLTAAKNGAVKIWNFNNGACLRELPIYDATEISSIVCPYNRIITGGWNKRLTEYLDSNDCKAARWLTPPHRNDILDMALYPPHILASCSYDGDIFIWSLDKDTLMYCLNVNTNIYPQSLSAYIGSNIEATARSSKIHLQQSLAATSRRRGMVQQKMPGVSVLEEERTTNTTPTLEYAPPPTNIFQFSVEKLVFLQTRPLKKDTATLLAGHSNGFVRAWSVHQEGRLLGEFHAAHRQGETLTSMVTDSTNKFVVTGDSSGYIKVWGVAKYCVEMDSETPPTLNCEIEEEYNSFPFVKWRKLVLKTCKRRRSWLTNPCLDDGSYPMIVNSFRGHLREVMSLDIAELSKRTLIVSASRDNSIRLWAITGEVLGIFGAKNWWIGVDSDGLTQKRDKHQQPDKSESRGRHVYGKPKETLPNQISTVPTDVRRVASATTLRVLNSGDTEYQFKLPKVVLRWIAKVTARGFFKNGEKSSRTLFDKSAAQPFIHIPSTTEMAMEKETLGKSKILKGAYKRTTRHRKLPDLLNITSSQYHDSICVFRNLPYTELVPIPSIPMPDTMKEIIQRTGIQVTEVAERTKQVPHKGRQRSQLKDPATRKPDSYVYISGSSHGSNTGALYEALASSTVKEARAPKRLSARIEDVLGQKLPAINTKPGGVRIEAAKSKVNKQLGAIRSSLSQ